MRPLTAVLLLLAAALPASAGGLFNLAGKSIDEYTITLRARGWTSDQDSVAQDSTSSQPGSEISFPDDTNLDRRIYMPWAEGRFRYKECGIRVDGFFASDQVRGRIKDGEGFAGHLFLANDRALTRFTVVQGSAHFEWTPINLGSEKKIGLQVGILVGARVTRMEAYLRDSASGDSFRSSLVAVGPDPGLSVQVGVLNCLELEGWVAGMQFRLGTYDYRCLEAGAELRLYLDEHFYVGGGYRFSYVSVERGNARTTGRLLEYRYHGPSVVIGLQF